MSRLDSDSKEKIIELIKKGESLNDIIKITGKCKTTIYYYMKCIIGKKHKPVNINLDNSELIGEIVGLFAGDGYYAHSAKRWDNRIKIYFNAREDKLIDYYKSSFCKLIDKNPGVIRAGSCTIMQVCSKEFCSFILCYLTFGNRKVKTVELKDKNYYKNKLFMKGFLRGLIDSDGYVRKERREIYYGSISIKLFQDFLTGLKIFGFNYKTYLQKSKYSDFYKVRLKGEDVDRFIDIIKPIKALH